MFDGMSEEQARKKILEEVTGIRKWAFQYLQKVIDGCIRRCDGDRNAMSEYM